MRQNFARQLENKDVMDSDGRMIGTFADLEYHSQTGDLQRLLVKKTEQTNRQLAHKYDTDDYGRYVVPTQTIQSVDDCIIVAAN